MSFRTNPTVDAFIAGADLSAKQYYFVKLDASNANEVVLAGAGEEAIGILTNTPASGEAAEVTVSGGSYLSIADATIAIDSMVKSDAAGQGTIASVTGDFAVARVIEAGTSADDFVEVIVEKRLIA